MTGLDCIRVFLPGESWWSSSPPCLHPGCVRKTEGATLLRTTANTDTRCTASTPCTRRSWWQKVSPDCGGPAERSEFCCYNLQCLQRVSSYTSLLMPNDTASCNAQSDLRLHQQTLEAAEKTSARPCFTQCSQATVCRVAALRARSLSMGCRNVHLAVRAAHTCALACLRFGEPKLGTMSMPYAPCAPQ